MKKETSESRYVMVKIRQFIGFITVMLLVTRDVTLFRDGLSSVMTPAMWCETCPGSEWSHNIVLHYIIVLCSTKLSQQLSCLLVCINCIIVHNGLGIMSCLSCGFDHVSRIIKMFTRPGSLRQLTAPVTQIGWIYRMKITGPLSYLFIHSGCPVIS